MADQQCLRRTSAALLGVLLLALASPLAAAPQAKLRIGTFDSRFVALAFYRSAHGVDAVKTLQEDLANAKTANDAKRVKELEAKGPALQNLMHQQVFGNLSIPNVLAAVSDSLPAIASKAGVAMLVSKWEIRCNTSGAELVDVTPQLIDLFDVDDATRKMIDEGMENAQAPVPVDQLLNPYD